LRPTGIREHDVEPALLPLDLCEEAIEIAQVRHVASYAGHISSDVLDRCRQLRITAPRDEDVGAFVHELLRRRQANAAVATSDERDFPFKLPHGFLLHVDRGERHSRHPSVVVTVSLRPSAAWDVGRLQPDSGVEWRGMKKYVLAYNMLVRPRRGE